MMAELLGHLGLDVGAAPEAAPEGADPYETHHFSYCA
jgi:hypothetical protein